MINIVISCAAGSLKKYEALYFKKKSSIKNIVQIIGIDINKKLIDKKCYDFVESIPKPESKNYLKILYKIIKKYNAKFVFIGADEEALKISKNINRFKKIKVKFMINNYKTVKILSDKIETFRKLKKFKKILPNWHEAKNEKKLLNYIDIYLKRSGSVVIKPSISRGGRNVFIISDKKFIKSISKREKDMNLIYFKKNYLKNIKKSYPFMVMEKLNNPVFDLDILADNGKLTYALLRKRLNSRDPNSGHKIIKRKDVFLIAKRIAKTLRLNTINDCDFMLDKNKNLKLLEINPRPSGSFAIPNLANIHILDYVIKKYLYNKEITKIKSINKDILVTKKKLNKIYNEKN